MLHRWITIAVTLALFGAGLLGMGQVPVSYTHLDVYKRQIIDSFLFNFWPEPGMSGGFRATLMIFFKLMTCRKVAFSQQVAMFAERL